METIFSVLHEYLPAIFGKYLCSRLECLTLVYLSKELFFLLQIENVPLLTEPPCIYLPYTSSIDLTALLNQCVYTEQTN